MISDMQTRSFDPRPFNGIQTLTVHKYISTPEEVEHDELLEDAVKLALENGSVSGVMIQNKFRIGYARASQILDTLDYLKIVGALDYSASRTLNISTLSEAKVIIKKYVALGDASK